MDFQKSVGTLSLRAGWTLKTPQTNAALKVNRLMGTLYLLARYFGNKTVDSTSNFHYQVLHTMDVYV